MTTDWGCCACSKEGDCVELAGRDIASSHEALVDRNGDGVESDGNVTYCVTIVPCVLRAEMVADSGVEVTEAEAKAVTVSVISRVEKSVVTCCAVAVDAAAAL